MSSTSIVRPRLSFWQIWNMSFGFMGIQFGFALQNANTSRIFETLGADTSNLALYWLAAPITGLIVQPIIGYYSDRTWHPNWGRRRPYFAIGALLASIALCLMPNAPILWMAVGVLWIMDASINISMEPFRAFVGDMLPPSQRTAGFAMQSFFIGTGAVIASSLPYVLRNWFEIGDHDAVIYSFYIGGFMLFTTVMWTVFRTKEYPPTKESEEILKDRTKRKLINEDLSKKRFLKLGITLIVIGGISSLAIQELKIEKELYILPVGIAFFGAVFLVSWGYIIAKKSYLGIVQISDDFLEMPKTMVQLAFVQFFSWFALFSMWIYTTSATTSYMYDMKLTQQDIQNMQHHIQNIDQAVFKKLKTEKEEISNDLNILESKIQNGTVQSTIKIVEFFLKDEVNKFLKQDTNQNIKNAKHNYDRGADWVGILFAVYNGVAAIIAWLLPLLAKYTSRRLTHLIALFAGGIGLASFYLISDPHMLILSMIGVGIAWASILSIPYAMLSGSLPAEKMGYYMGVFNFFIVIPQIVAGTILGFMLTHFFNGQTIYILVTGGISMIIAGLLNLMVDDRDEVIIKQQA